MVSKKFNTDATTTIPTKRKPVKKAAGKKKGPAKKKVKLSLLISKDYVEEKGYDIDLMHKYEPNSLSPELWKKFLDQLKQERDEGNTLTDEEVLALESKWIPALEDHKKRIIRYTIISFDLKDEKEKVPAKVEKVPKGKKGKKAVQAEKKSKGEKKAKKVPQKKKGPKKSEHDKCKELMTEVDIAYETSEVNHVPLKKREEEMEAINDMITLAGFLLINREFQQVEDRDRICSDFNFRKEMKNRRLLYEESRSKRLNEAWEEVYVLPNGKKVPGGVSKLDTWSTKKQLKHFMYHHGIINGKKSYEEWKTCSNMSIGTGFVREAAAISSKRIEKADSYLKKQEEAMKEMESRGNGTDYMFENEDESDQE